VAHRTMSLPSNVSSLWRIDIVVCRESYHTVVKRFVWGSKPEIPVPVLFVPSGLKKVKSDCRNLPSLDHVLLTRAFRHERLPIHWEERLDDVSIARKLREQPLTGTGRVWRLVLIVGLLCDRRSGNEQRRRNPFLHGTRMICGNREHCTPGGACQVK
jgi:hypothetical protein